MRPFLQWSILSLLLLASLPILFPGRLLPITWHPGLLVTVYLLGISPSIFGRFISRHRHAESWLPTSLPQYMLLLWLPINIWASTNYVTAWITTGYLILGIALYIALIRNPFALSWKLSATLLLGIGSFLALISPLLITWKPQFRLFYFPIYDYLQLIHLNINEAVHPNVLAGALVLTLPLTIVSVWWQNVPHPPKRRAGWKNPIIVKLITLASLLLQVGMLILSQSRGGYLAFVVSLVFIAIISQPRLLYLTPFILLASVVGSQAIDLSAILEQFSTDGSLGGWAGRVEIWQTSVAAIHDFPFTGIGIGTFTTVIPLLYPLSFPIENYPHAHNLFLQIALDLGVPGLIAYLSLLINLGVMLTVTLRNAPRHTLVYTLAIGAAGSVMAMVSHGMLDAVLWDTKLSFLPWLLFALITQLFLQMQQMKFDQKANEKA